VDDINSEGAEIISVKGEDTVDAMDFHDGDQASVVHPDSGDFVQGDETFPSGIGLAGIGQKHKEAFQFGHFPGRLFR
jgi:hypothetical protein